MDGPLQGLKHAESICQLLGLDAAAPSLRSALHDHAPTHIYAQRYSSLASAAGGRMFSSQCGQPEAIPVFINLAFQVVLAVRTVEVKTARVSRDKDNRPNGNAGESAEGDHVITFSDRKQFGIGH